MKNILLVSLLLAQTIQVSAQDAHKKLPAERKNEIGIMSQFSNISSGNGDMTLQGIQFKRWKNEMVGLRLVAAYGNYQNYGYPFSIKAASDTVVEKSAHTKIGLGVIGVGVEAQRRFYKRIYLYAAIELKAGYGAGNSDTVTAKRLANSNPSDHYSYAASGNKGDASMIYFGLAPSIGAKFNFNRISFGMEVFAANMGYQNIQYKNSVSVSSGDFDMGTISQRVFINFRF